MIFIDSASVLALLHYALGDDLWFVTKSDVSSFWTHRKLEDISKYPCFTSYLRIELIHGRGNTHLQDSAHKPLPCAAPSSFLFHGLDADNDKAQGKEDERRAKPIGELLWLLEQLS